MELKELHHVINTHLNDNSLAQAKYEEDLLNEYVIVEHLNNKDGSVITISKNLGCWHLEYERNKHSGTFIEMQIANTNDNKDVDEILQFINTHTLISVAEKSESTS